MRCPWFVASLTSCVAVAIAAADVPIAPAPREIRSDGSRDPVPDALSSKNEDPRQLVERIIKNSQVVGEKLANRDTGTATQTTQAAILRDIDALLNRQDDPPPMPDPNSQPNMGSNQSDPKTDKTDKKDDRMPMGGMEPKDPKNQAPDTNTMNMGGSKDQQPMGAGQPHGKDHQPMSAGQSRGHRPRQHAGRDQARAEQQPNPKATDSKPAGMQQAQQPPQSTGAPPPNPRPGPPVASRRTLPLEEDVIKNVWGHLPDKLRQQASEYYKQELMPRYAELLRLYYSSLVDKEK